MSTKAICNYQDKIKLVVILCRLGAWGRFRLSIHPQLGPCATSQLVSPVPSERRCVAVHGDLLRGRIASLWLWEAISTVT